MTEPRHKSVSLFFFSGDFAEAWRRHHAGEQQSYATHTEVVRLMLDLQAGGVSTTVYSFMTPETKTEVLSSHVRVVSLGAHSWQPTELLLEALASDESTALIPHFPNVEFIRACLKTGRDVMIGMANSYNRRGLKAVWEQHRLARLLNDRRISLVSNHCSPATRKLADYGVRPEKLVPWDIPHARSPAEFPAKKFPTGRVFTVAYAGLIARTKGVGELVEAVGILNAQGLAVRAVCAGRGDIEDLKALAEASGAAGHVDFLGVIGNADVIRLFREADLVCIPSRYEFPEGMPLTMFEAIACRTPVVCSDHPMFVPIMGVGERAEVFRASDPQALTAAVRRALASKEHYERLSRNADHSWAALQGAADWRTLLGTWVLRGAADPWIVRHTLAGSA